MGKFIKLHRAWINEVKDFCYAKIVIDISKIECIEPNALRTKRDKEVGCTAITLTSGREIRVIEKFDELIKLLPQNFINSLPEESAECSGDNNGEQLREYHGKYILRDGDLHAEMLDSNLCAHKKYTRKFLAKLKEIGLLFDSRRDAEYARSRFIGGKIIQPPEWSKEDVAYSEIIITELKRLGLNDTADWFKSLKERYTWKPSDEQVDAVKDAIDYLGCNTQKVREYLMSLYEQLKKLKDLEI